MQQYVYLFKSDEFVTSHHNYDKFCLAWKHQFHKCFAGNFSFRARCISRNRTQHMDASNRKTAATFWSLAWRQNELDATMLPTERKHNNVWQQFRKTFCNFEETVLCANWWIDRILFLGITITVFYFNQKDQAHRKTCSRESGTVTNLQHRRPREQNLSESHSLCATEQWFRFSKKCHPPPSFCCGVIFNQWQIGGNLCANFTTNSDTPTCSTGSFCWLRKKQTWYKIRTFLLASGANKQRTNNGMCNCSCCAQKLKS